MSLQSSSMNEGGRWTNPVPKNTVRITPSTSSSDCFGVWSPSSKPHIHILPSILRFPMHIRREDSVLKMCHVGFNSNWFTFRWDFHKSKWPIICPEHPSTEDDHHYHSMQHIFWKRPVIRDALEELCSKLVVEIHRSHGNNKIWQKLANYLFHFAFLHASIFKFWYKINNIAFILDYQSFLTIIE